MFLGEHKYYNKRLMYEESLRMSLVVRYPREIPVGSTNGDLNLEPGPPRDVPKLRGCATPGPHAGA